MIEVRGTDRATGKKNCWLVWLHCTTPAKQGSRAREGVGNVLGEVTYLSGDAGLRSTG